MSNVKPQRGREESPRVGLTSDSLPKVRKPIVAMNSYTGVSTNIAQYRTPQFLCKHRKADTSAHWYVLRTTYGREKRAYDYMIAQGATAFYPTLTTIKLVKGKRKTVEVSRLPNLFFVYGTYEDMKSFVYDNVNLPYLRFCYRYFHVGGKIEKEPLIVPDRQIESLRIICQAKEDDIVVSTDEVQKFKQGQLVRIIEGKFKGVIGTVARYQGQQRVGVVIDGLLTVATAYIPSAFITST